MFNQPKELPPLNPPQLPAKNTFVQPALPDNGNLTIKTETPAAEARKTFNLPIIEMPRSQDIIIAPPSTRQERKYPVVEEETPSFDEAIKSIHRDIMRISESEKKEEPQEAKKEEYYAPKQLGEGYFSEIKHYLKNRDVKEIVEDIIKKDFLTGMKDYHDHRQQGKPFYLHDHDLKQKLEKRMEELMHKEEAWHEIKTVVEENDRKKRLLEKEIDTEGQELKDLFKLIKANQLLEREAKPGQQFTLRSGQKLVSLNDLRKTLSYMSDDEFSHHANKDRNDFANWIENALEMPEIGHKVRNAKTKAELEHTLKNLIS